MISITLPSLYPDACYRTLANIAATTRGEYEVIVVSPHRIVGDRVRWVVETEAMGCAYAHDLAASFVKGDHVFAFADDHELIDGWDVIAMENFIARRAAFMRDPYYVGGPFCLGLRGTHSSHVGTNFGMYYPYFPFMKRLDVSRIGWIGRHYRAGFGDSDLAMRVWHTGGRCEWSDVGLLRPTASDKRKEGATQSGRRNASFTDDDLRLFVSKWSWLYGEGWSGGSIDDFNIDLRPEDNAHLVDPKGRTFRHNSPDFLAKAVRMAG